MQHERHALGGLERFEHDEQCEPDGISQLDILFRAPLVTALHTRLRFVSVECFLAARVSRAEHVEAHAPDDRRHPPAQIVHRVGVGSTHAQPCLLYGVLRSYR